MATVRKFAIDTYFSPTGEILSDGPEPEPTVSLRDHEEAIRVAYDAGRRDELVRAEEALAQEIHSLGGAITKLGAAWRADVKSLESAAAQLAMAAARTVAGAALETFGEARVGEVLEASLAAIGDPPRLALRLPSGIADRAIVHLQNMLEANGLSEVAHIRADARLTSGQAAIEWQDGAILLDAAQHFERLEALLRDRLAHSAEHGESA